MAGYFVFVPSWGCNPVNALAIVAAGSLLDPAVTQLCCKDFEWQSERLHQCSALIPNSPVDLNAKAISNC